MTNLFGALDLEEIPDVPPAGTYPLVLREVRQIVSRAGDHYLIFEFYIDKEADPETLFPDYKISKMFRIYPDMTSEILNNLDTQEKVKVLRNINSLREFFASLCLDEEDMKDFKPEMVRGYRGYGYGQPRERRDGQGKEWVLYRFTPAE